MATVSLVYLLLVLGSFVLTWGFVGLRNHHHLVRQRQQLNLSSSSDDARSFDWTTEWYPVVPVQDLNFRIPNKITLLGMDFCVWFDNDQWHAFADVCPHRLVPLSEGRIEAADGDCRLQCAYHGWEFSGSGDCVRIPQLGPQLETQPSSVSASRASATSFPVRIAQKLLWIFPTANDPELANSKELALIPQLDDPENVDATNLFVRDLPYSYDILVENLCDPSHVTFAHHGYMSGADRYQKQQQLDLKVTHESDAGFVATKDPPPPGNADYTVKFQSPCLLYYSITSSNSYIGLGSYCIPTAPGQCRLIARFPFRLAFKPAMFFMRHTPRWINHFSQNIVLDSDVVFLCSQEERLRNSNNRMSNLDKSNVVAQDYYMPAQSDAIVVAFRKWLRTVGAPKWLGVPASRSAGERLGWVRPRHMPVYEGRDALLDRYRQHTDICSSCRRAHVLLYRMRDLLTYAGIGLLAGGSLLVDKRRKVAAAAASVVLLLVPRFALQPLIARLECVPWPRKKWLESSRPEKSIREEYRKVIENEEQRAQIFGLDSLV